MFNNEAYFEPILSAPTLRFPKGTKETPHQIALQRLRQLFGSGMQFMRMCKKIGGEQVWADADEKWQWLVYRKFTANQYSKFSNLLKGLKAERSCEKNPCSTRA